MAVLAIIGISTAAGTASADCTGIIYGRQACEDTARSYRNAGYTADCILLVNDKYVVDYHRSNYGDTAPPSLQGFVQRLAGILATGSASASQ
ncbi:hypothetical protein ACQP1O_42775 (plasmid) [Nocardia sp. CA-151230]|uniref:hypothetical protein n=1 Tax=Nocardia sp. CA-151230 TaxID=3239982 RepID=UPI003D94A565